MKALDLHHMVYDFPFDARISSVNLNRFREWAERRYENYMAAREYLIRSGQASEIDELSGDDVMAMKEYADRFGNSGKLESMRPDSGQFHRSHTVSLDYDYMEQMRMVVKSTVRGIQFE